MDVQKLGVLEIFFGPPWTHEDRLSWAEFLGREQMGFYLYGPKADSQLRKNWREPWSKKYLLQLQDLAKSFYDCQVKFAVALSPFGVQHPFDSITKELIETKCKQLCDVGIDFLGLFFDDMPSADGLADTQIEIATAVSAAVKLPIVFCPSYYTSDPILNKVFGNSPPGYLERLGRGLPRDMEILWTGPKVISPEISADHLRATAKLLKRKPFVCDNLFANDGPKNCKFIQLKPLQGRDQRALPESSHWSLNLMNKSALSQLIGYSTKLVFTTKIEPEQALRTTLNECLTEDCACALWRDREQFAYVGLDEMLTTLKEELAKQYATFPDEAAKEVVRWLRGDYLVGSECLTD